MLLEQQLLLEEEKRLFSYVAARSSSFQTSAK
jgi:hypothetical protein